MIRLPGKKTKPPPIGKLEAAERQLALAIRLFFAREDSIGIHTLMAPASQVLRDLAQHAGIANPIRKNDLIHEGLNP